MNSILEHIQALEKSQRTPENIYALSQLYRKTDQFDQEKKLIEDALQFYHSNQYLQKRKRWLDTPPFFRSQPKALAQTPRPDKPSQDVINQMCFVIGTSPGYFHMTVECLESILNTQDYKHVPICIIDCGLSKEQISYFKKHFKITELKQIDWSFPVPYENKNDHHVKTTLERPFLTTHFPGYRYYFWLDADTWIQTESAVDAFVKNAYNFGLGICEDVFNTVNDMQWQNETLCDEDQKITQRVKAINAGVFCIDAQSEIFSIWQKILARSIQSKGFNRLLDQPTLALTAYHKNVPILNSPTQYLDCLGTFGIPLVHNGVLKTTYTFETIGIYHMVWAKVYGDLAYHIPTKEIDHPLSSQEIHDHRVVSIDLLEGKIDVCDVPYKSFISLHSRQLVDDFD